MTTVTVEVVAMTILLGLPTLYLVARVLSSAYFASKMHYHKRLTNYITRGDHHDQ